jgi:hypothetical protein
MVIRPFIRCLFKIGLFPVEQSPYQGRNIFGLEAKTVALHLIGDVGCHLGGQVGGCVQEPQEQLDDKARIHSGQIEAQLAILLVQCGRILLRLAKKPAPPNRAMAC